MGSADGGAACGDYAAGICGVTKEMRLVQVGESAGATISLPAAVLRSTALTIMGTAGISFARDFGGGHGASFGARGTWGIAH